MIERDALSKMNHPGIVKLYWTFKDDQSLCKDFISGYSSKTKMYV